MAGMGGHGGGAGAGGGLPEDVGGGTALLFQAGGGVFVGPCGACKFLRRKCVAGCVFSPYFRSEEGASHFAAVHRVFGASNVSKLLAQIPDDKRLDAVVTICYEAQARIRDAVYGCTSHINALQQQVARLQSEVAYLQAQIARLEMLSPPPPHAAMLVPPPPPPVYFFDIPPSPSTLPTTVDLAGIFPSPPEQQLPCWQHEELQPQQPTPQQQEQHIILELQQLLDGTGDDDVGSSFMQSTLEIADVDLVEESIYHPSMPK